MGSYAGCWLGSLYVGSSKNDVDPALMTLFRAADRVSATYTKETMPVEIRERNRSLDDGEEVRFTYYRAPVKAIRDRLELMGYTVQTARVALQIVIKAAAARHALWALDRTNPSWADQNASTAKMLTQASVDAWLLALKEISEAGLERSIFGASNDAYAGTLIGYMLENDWYGYDGPDKNVPLRLALDVCSDAEELIYDVTDLSLSEYFTEDTDFVGYALAQLSSDYTETGKVIILTEGRSDARILLASLELLYPHLRDHFAFMDFEGARVSGGAGELANLVKAFAGAGIVNKIIAVFDNDTAAELARQSLKTVRLPWNIRIVTLPELPFLRRYPTIGPSGPVEMDVNGVAASIELYVGKDVLEEENGLAPAVQWTGYVPALKKYQGEVLTKDRIQERFERRLDACRKDPQRLDATDWSGLRAILTALLIAFQDADGEKIRALHESYFADETGQS